MQKNRVDLRRDYPKGIQVVFALESIEIKTTEGHIQRPPYTGSRSDGGLNDGVCSTALYLFDQHNMAAEPSPGLELRQRLDVWRTASLRRRRRRFRHANRADGLRGGRQAVSGGGADAPARLVQVPGHAPRRPQRAGSLDGQR